MSSATRKPAGAGVVVADGSGGPCVVGEPLVAGRPRDHGCTTNAGLAVAAGEDGPVGGGFVAGPERSFRRWRNRRIPTSPRKVLVKRCSAVSFCVAEQACADFGHVVRVLPSG